MALGFRDSDALRVVISSGLCPAEVASRAAQVARAPDGSMVVDPEVPLGQAALRKLRSAGVRVDAAIPGDARAVRCWAEAIAPGRVALPEVPSLLLLVTERARELVDLAAELLRLGCDRQELTIAEGAGVIRVVDAPTYTVMRALDREGGLRVYAPDPAGQEVVWTELGHRHPLADRLRAEPGTLLLVGGDRWRTIPDAGWRGLDAVLALVVPGEPATLAPADPLPARRTIELRLRAGRREPPSLWVLRQGGVAAIDRLLAHLPEDVVQRLSFAVAGGDDPVVIVRARSRRHAPPELAFGAEEYAPLPDLPDVYAPAGAIIEPPLRRDRLRSVLGAADGDVLWLAPLPDRRFCVERIAERAFRPLVEWADYVLHASAPALAPWMRATVFDFAPFVSTGLEWSSGPPSEDRAEPARRERRPVRTRPQPAEPDAAFATPRAPSEAAAAPVQLPEAPAVEVSVDAELALLETRFIELDGAGDVPERIALLEQLGSAYARLGRRRDAGLCFARAVWESSAEQATARLDAWIAADGGLAGRSALDRILAQTDPHLEDVRVVAALAARADAGSAQRGIPHELARDPHRVQRWLDEHDRQLDARTLWLSRLGLARLAGGDLLGLAHTRDRILARLAGGLPVELELPAFLQLSGRSGALGSASGEHLSRALEDLAQRLGRTRRRRSMMEAPPQYTGAYVQLQLAHGFARIGRPVRARALVGEAQHALAPVASDPVHAYLAAAFAARVEQAIEGLAPEVPLPDALGAQLAALDRLSRYKVERLREASRILAPLEGSDAMGAFLLRHRDTRGPEFAALPTEPRARASALGSLVDQAAASEAERGRLLAGILEVLLELPEASAVPILARAWPLIARLAAPRRAVLYAEALVAAGHFGSTEQVPPLLLQLGAAVRVTAAPDLGRVVRRSLRALRRIGLRAELAELLASAELALHAGGPEVLPGRLALAAGLAFLGDTGRALPIFDQARLALIRELTALGEVAKDAPRPPLTQLLEVIRALALAYGQAPLPTALGGIAELATHFRAITDNFGTNSHFCLSVLHFVESLVLGITSDDLVLGEAGRRLIEDDEHLIRRRVHRDLGGSS